MNVNCDDGTTIMRNESITMSQAIINVVFRGNFDKVDLRRCFK